MVVPEGERESSSQDAGIGINPSLPCTTKRRITTNLKINKQPEVSENQTAWNSDNQGIKKQLNRRTSLVRQWMERYHVEAAG